MKGHEHFDWLYSYVQNLSKPTFRAIERKLRRMDVRPADTSLNYLAHHYSFLVDIVGTMQRGSKETGYRAYVLPGTRFLPRSSGDSFRERYVAAMQADLCDHADSEIPHTGHMPLEFLAADLAVQDLLDRRHALISDARLLASLLSPSSLQAEGIRALSIEEGKRLLYGFDRMRYEG